MLYLYDLYQEKHTYLCEHQTLKKAKGLHVSFNPDDPIILVGDERGGVNSFKLSGNLVLGNNNTNISMTLFIFRTNATTIR